MAFTHQVNMHANKNASSSSLGAGVGGGGGAVEPRSTTTRRRESFTSSHAHAHSMDDRLSTSPSGGTSSPLHASGGRTTAPSFLYLPPGISLHRNGCGEETQLSISSGLTSSNSAAAAASRSRSSPPNVTIGFDPTKPTLSAGSTQPRKLSSSSSSSSSETSSCCASSSSTGPISSLASSVATTDDAPSSSASTTTTPKRSASISSGTGAGAGARRPSLPGEDPQLAAARRALWEDVVVEDPPRSAAKEEGTTTPLATSTAVFEDVFSSENDDDEPEGALNEEEDDADDGEDRIRPHEPSHATLPPLPSCLRPPAPSRTHSNTSVSSTTLVRISEEPPRAFTTYSAIDYERRGEGPVEKLSIREWIELQGVREAVGVWSGKITANDLKDDDKVETTTTMTDSPLSPLVMQGHPSTANGVRRIVSLPNSPMIKSRELPVPKRSVSGSVLEANSDIAQKDGDDDDDATTPLHHLKSACLGVRTVTHNVRPVAAPASLWDD